LLYLEEQADEEGREQGKGLNRPAKHKQQMPSPGNQRTCRANHAEPNEDEQSMDDQTVEVKVEVKEVESSVIYQQ
jgi:hypothetical protein